MLAVWNFSLLIYGCLVSVINSFNYFYELMSMLGVAKCGFESRLQLVDDHGFTIHRLLLCGGFCRFECADGMQTLFLLR